MRLSFLISILVHVLLLWAVLTLFDVVPEIRVPKKIYNVKIFRPFVAPPKEERKEAEVKVEEKKPPPVTKVEKPKENKPEPKPKEPEPKAPEEKPLDVSVQEEGDQTELTVDAPRFPFSYYLSAIERRVTEHWISAGSTRGAGDTCVVYFRLSRNGRVSDLKVEESSGSQHFDRSALRAIKSAEPFPPLPRGFDQSWLGIHFTFLQKR
jgi:protein TonB